MRCGECEAAGLVEPCFCPCCGRPLPAVRPGQATTPVHAAPTPDHPCASCGTPVPTQVELCDECELAFQGVLQTSSPPAAEPGPEPGPAPTFEDDTPTLIAAPWSFEPPGEVGDDPPPFEAQAPETLAQPQAAAFEGDAGQATFAEPRPWWEAEASAVAAPASATAPLTGLFEAFPGSSSADVGAIPAPVQDATSPAEPKPWWEISETATPAASASAPAVDLATPPVPAFEADTSGEAIPVGHASHVPPAPPPEPVRTVEAPASRAVDAVRPPRPRPARPVAPARRERRTPVGRMVAVAVGSAALCVVALLGLPGLFDLTWNAPAPLSSPAVPPPAESPAPAPATTPATTEPAAAPAPATPPPAAAVPSASRPEPVAASKNAQRPGQKPRADTAAGSRAARLLQQRAAAQARPSASAPAPEARLDLPRPVVVESPPAPVAAAPEPAIPTDVLGTAFEVTQVDVRPQVVRQVPPRRPDARTSAEVVVVRVLVSPSGRAADVRVVRGAKGAPDYDAAAIAAVRQWTFSPAQKRSKTVSCWVHVGVPFAAQKEGA